MPETAAATADHPGAWPLARNRARHPDAGAEGHPRPRSSARNRADGEASPASAAPGLARRLREGTADVHRAAERMAMIQALLRGVADRRAYGELLRAYHAIYGALEAALLRSQDDPAIAALTVPALFRQPAIAADLAVVVGSVGGPPRPATRAYVDRIHEVAATRPRLLLAHAYVRTFGDLAGGRILGRIVGRALGLAPGAGLDFYAFPGIADPAALLVDLRGRLDALDLAGDEVEALVAEARRAFACNIAVFAELEGSALRGLARLMWGRGSRQPGPARADAEVATAAE